MTPIEASNIRVRIMGSKVAGGERNSNLRFGRRQSVGAAGMLALALPASGRPPGEVERRRLPLRLMDVLANGSGAFR
jgi:hypothetical protein